MRFLRNMLAFYAVLLDFDDLVERAAARLHPTPQNRSNR